MGDGELEDFSVGLPYFLEFLVFLYFKGAKSWLRPYFPYFLEFPTFLYFKGAKSWPSPYFPYFPYFLEFPMFLYFKGAKSGKVGLKVGRLGKNHIG